MSILGVWMWPQSVAQHGAESVADHCARAGITDIYFLTKGLAGTAAYRSSLAPCTAERDLLGELLCSAHARGIRVHAWFTSASDEHYKALHPESGRCHYIRGKDKGLIALTDEGYLSYMEKIVREVCRNYEIDGLHLDYIRYNHLLYGWSEEDLARYTAAGADIPHVRSLMERTFLREEQNEEQCIFDALRNGDESLQALARVRRTDVTRFASTLCGLARAEKKELILSAALMPEGAYSDTAYADLHYGQSYEDAAMLYDYALPMAYSQAYDKGGQWVRQVAEGTLKRGLRTVMGLHAYEGGTGATLREDIAALADAPIDGICLFREGAFAMAYAEGEKLQIYNPLDKTITGIIARKDAQRITLENGILPGEERSLLLPFEPDSLRVFSGDTEVSVYLAGK